MDPAIIHPHAQHTDVVGQVMTSIDLVSNIVSTFSSPNSRSAQAWLASLALVHPTWSRPVYFALRQHPIILSISQLLSFQDSFRTQPDRFNSRSSSSEMETLDPKSKQPQKFKPERSHHQYTNKTVIPSAAAVRSILIHFGQSHPIGLSENLAEIDSEKHRRQLEVSKELYLDPVFFNSLTHLRSIHLSTLKLSINNLSFLLSSLSDSLIELGIHDLYFVGSRSNDDHNRLIFNSIFELPHLNSLSLTGRLATTYPLLPIDKLGSIHQKKPLETLSLSSVGLTSGGSTIIDPQTLLACWTSCLKDNQNKFDETGKDTSLKSSSSEKESNYSLYRDPLKILNYRIFTNDEVWYLPNMMNEELKRLANQLGIRIEVIGSSNLNCYGTPERIKWMSSNYL